MRRRGLYGASAARPSRPDMPWEREAEVAHEERMQEKTRTEVEFGVGMCERHLD
jgi:hypothetical protein